MGRRLAWCVAFSLGAGACTVPSFLGRPTRAAPSAAGEAAVAPAVDRSDSADGQDDDANGPDDEPTPAGPPLSDPKKHLPPARARDVAKARRLLEKGLAAYRNGDYDRAEAALKGAMTLYPFLAEANLALGKIFLIRGSARLDRSFINNARLMFEMAHTLDPNLVETQLLLELFTAEPP